MTNGWATTRAAVWDGAALTLDEIEVVPPGPGEARVRVLASGICRSDLHVLDGHGTISLPVVLGHEGAGIVESIGPGVHHLEVGDPVVIGTSSPCGECHVCVSGRPGACQRGLLRESKPFRWQGVATRAYASTGSWAGMTTTRAEQLVPAPGVRPEAAALIGCAVSTGWGVVNNVASVRPGDVVVVLGVGGIGVNALQAARLAGAGRVVAVDVDPARNRTAQRFGADAFVTTERGEPADALAARIVEAANGPADVAIECTGAPAVIDAAITSVGWNGRVALVGIPPPGTRASFDVNRLLGNRSIVGSYNGTTDVPGQFPELVEHVRTGRLDVDAQISKVWPLAEIEQAIEAVRAGSVIRAVIVH